MKSRSRHGLTVMFISLGLILTGNVAATPSLANEATSQDALDVAPNNLSEGVAAERSAPSNEYNGLRFADVDNMKSRFVGHHTPGATMGWIEYPNKFAKAIYWMAQEGLTTGTATTNTFGNSVRMYYPESNLSRAAMAAFMYRQAGSPRFTQPTKDFSDVKPGDKFYREISWMSAMGLSTGYADGSYRPGGTLSRAAMAAFLYRQKGQPKFASKGNFNDSRSSQFAVAIEWMKATGRSTGFADGGYHPDEAISREAMAAFLYRDAGSPWMPTIPPDLVLFGSNCNGGTISFYRSRGWSYASALKYYNEMPCHK